MVDPIANFFGTIGKTEIPKHGGMIIVPKFDLQVPQKTYMLRTC